MRNQPLFPTLAVFALASIAFCSCGCAHRSTIKSGTLHPDTSITHAESVQIRIAVIAHLASGAINATYFIPADLIAEPDIVRLQSPTLLLLPQNKEGHQGQFRPIRDEASIVFESMTVNDRIATVRVSQIWRGNLPASELNEGPRSPREGSWFVTSEFSLELQNGRWAVQREESIGAS